jgi:hypothetical protein
MINIRTRETRIVLMSQELIKLYQVFPMDIAREYQPITFYDPQDCLDIMIGNELEEEVQENLEAPEARIERLERQWGELELRLSFFVDSHKWQ